STGIANSTGSANSTGIANSTGSANSTGNDFRDSPVYAKLSEKINLNSHIPYLIRIKDGRVVSISETQYYDR
ncbi:MAG: hypothetical protein RRY35_01240, partial [Clostridiales bacterium]